MTFDFTNMNAPKAKSRLDNAVPRPPTRHFTERQKQALELSGEAEHEHGEKREALTREAERLGKAESKTRATDR